MTIAALNDFHGALYESKTKVPNEVAGGLPWVSGLLTAWRSETTPVFVLDGGDLFQGSWPVNASKGAAAIDAFNLLGIDASAVGNHEFDYGGDDAGHPLREALLNGGKNAQWHWLSANIVRTADNTPWAPQGFEGTAIIEKENIKLGVIGLSTTDTPETTLKKNVADLAFLDVVPTVSRYAASLRERNVDLIAVVGHLSGAPREHHRPNDVRPMVKWGDSDRVTGRHHRYFGDRSQSQANGLSTRPNHCFAIR